MEEADVGVVVEVGAARACGARVHRTAEATELSRVEARLAHTARLLHTGERAARVAYAAKAVRPTTGRNAGEGGVDRWRANGAELSTRDRRDRICARRDRRHQRRVEPWHVRLDKPVRRAAVVERAIKEL